MRQNFFKLDLSKIQTSKLASRVLTSKLIFMLISRLFARANYEIYKKSMLSIAPLRNFGQKSWFRVPAYNAIYEFLSKWREEQIIVAEKIAIEIGGCEGTLKSMLESFGIKYFVAPNFPQVDLHQLPYANDSFDLVILDQVLEHVKKPWIAVNEIYRILKPSGISIVTSPFIFPYHASPPWEDYYRFSPEGLKVLFSKFEIIVADGWGSAEAIRVSWKQSSFGPTPFSTPLQQAVEKKLFESNDRINYLITWCIARKPEGKSGGDSSPKEP